MESVTAAPIDSPTPEPFFSPDPVEVYIEYGTPTRQSRVTVAFRALLVAPHLVVLALLGALAVPLVVVGWLSALVLGRLPRWIARYQMGLIGYSIRVNAYMYLVADKFPPFGFSAPDYSVTVQIGASRVSRLKVFFRLLLVIPAYFVTGFALGGFVLLSPIMWLCTLILGRTPPPFFGVATAVIRYQARYFAYLSLVTDKYPRQLTGDGLTLSNGARRLMVLVILLGIANWVVGIVLFESAINDARARQASFDSATRQLEFATARFRVATSSCSAGPKRYLCHEAAERKWADAWDRFGSKMSQISFPSVQQAAGTALAHDGHAIAAALTASSRAKTKSAHNAAYKKVLQRLRRFESDVRLFDSGA